MSILLGFLASCGLAALVAIGAFLLLRAPLERLLCELCGNQERARFWSCFTGLGLFLATVLGCMVAFPLGDAAAWSDEPMARHVLIGLRASLVLLLSVVGVLGVVLSRAIARFEFESRRVRDTASELPTPG